MPHRGGAERRGKCVWKGQASVAVFCKYLPFSAWFRPTHLKAPQHGFFPLEALEEQAMPYTLDPQLQGLVS